MTSTIMQDLKASTESRHLEAEQLVGALGWDRSEAGYAAYLLKMWGFHAAIEPVLQHACRQHGLAIEARRFQKTAALEQDLSALSVTLDGAVRCTELPAVGAVGALPQALGAMYVLEGSTLGGQYLLRQVRKSLPLAAERAGAFLSIYGADTGPMWRAFRSIVEAHATAELSPAIVQSACDTFDALAGWLRQAPRPRSVIA